MKIVATNLITSWQIEGEKVETVTDFLFGGSKITVHGDCRMKLRHLLPRRKAMTNLDSVLLTRRGKAETSLHWQSYGFSSSHVWIRELYHKEGWVPKNWCFSNVVLEKTLKNPLDSKEMKPVNPKGNQPWIFVEKTDAEGWSSNTLATWYEEQTHWKRFWCWERLRARGEGGNRGWDGWMASLTQWAWVWANSRRW